MRRASVAAATFAAFVISAQTALGFVAPEFILTWGQLGFAPGEFNFAHFLTATPAGDVYVFTLQGAYVSSFAVTSPGRPWVDPEGFVIVPETTQQRIRAVRADGSFVTEWGELGTGPGQFHHPTAVAIDGTGAIYVMDKDNHRVQKFAAVATTGRTTSWGRLKVRYR